MDRVRSARVDRQRAIAPTVLLPRSGPWRGTGLASEEHDGRWR
jgi:hypothetical protein